MLPGTAKLLFGRSAWLRPTSMSPTTVLARHAGGAPAKPVMNRLIQQDPLRITYVNEAGEKTNEIMSRSEALAFAKNLNLDLILRKSVYLINLSTAFCF
jgi:hypothetical protein